MRVYVLVTLQNTPFPVGVEVYKDLEKAKEAKQRIESQYERNRVYLFERVIE